MDSKKYISPIRLFEHLHIDYNEPINVARIKKHIQAEFAMSESGIIEVEGNAYNKSDILTELENPLFEQKRWPYHLLLWQQKGLLSLVEEEVIDLDKDTNIFKNYIKDDSFKEFYSPYLIQPFNNLCRYLLNEKQDYTLSKFLQFDTFLLPQHRVEAYSTIRKYLLDAEKLFNNVSLDTIKLHQDDLYKWVKGSEWPYWFNKLPEELDDVKNEIVSKMVDLMVEIQYQYKKVCLNLSRNLVKLTKLDSSLLQIVRENHTVFEQNAGATPSGSFSSNPTTGTSEGGFPWWIIGLILLILKLIRVFAN